MMNGEAEAKKPIIFLSCAGYLRKWNLTTKSCCCTWPKKSQETSLNRPANFIQQPQVRRLLTRVKWLSSYCTFLNCASCCIHEIPYIACKHLQTKVAISRPLVDLRLLISLLLGGDVHERCLSQKTQ